MDRAEEGFPFLGRDYIHQTAKVTLRLFVWIKSRIDVTSPLRSKIGLRIQMDSKQEHGQSIVIGAGPAGLTAAYELTKHGHTPLVFEKDNRSGFPENADKLKVPVYFK